MKMVVAMAMMIVMMVMIMTGYIYIPYEAGSGPWVLIFLSPSLECWDCRLQFHSWSVMLEEARSLDVLGKHYLLSHIFRLDSFEVQSWL